MIKATAERARRELPPAALLVYQSDETLRALMEELLDAAAKVGKAWESLQAERQDVERASDIAADLDVQVFVLGRKCDSVTNQLDALTESLPEDE
jgi:hypothetical protein